MSAVLAGQASKATNGSTNVISVMTYFVKSALLDAASAADSYYARSTLGCACTVTMEGRATSAAIATRQVETLIKPKTSIVTCAWAGQKMKL